MYFNTILHASSFELHRLNRAFWLLRAEIEIHALGVMLALSALVCTIPVIGLSKEDFQMLLGIAAQIAAVSTFCGLLGRFGCRNTGSKMLILFAVMLDVPVLCLSVATLAGLLVPWAVFWGEIPRLISFILTLNYLAELAEGASEPEIVGLFHQARRAVYLQVLIWPAMIFSTLGACAGVVAFACFVLPLVPMGLFGFGIYLFVRVVVNYSLGVRRLRKALALRIKELEEDGSSSSSIDWVS